MASWLSSALQTVRETSKDALDFVRKDLTEFTTTIKSDTEVYLNKIKTQEVGDLGINRFVSTLSSAVQAGGDSGISPTTASFDRVHDGFSRMLKDESTYLTDPTPKEAFENWLQTTNFNVDNRKGDIAQVLIDAPDIRALYARLVPAQASHIDFWSRYYFRLYQLEEDKVRHTQLLQRVKEMCSENDDKIGTNKEDDWDEPDEDLKKESSSDVQEVQAVEQKIETMPETERIQETHTERKESDTGDSWEREFDETDMNILPKSVKTSEESSTNSEEIIPSCAAASETATTTEETSTSVEKKPSNEFDDEWESWA